MMTTSRASLYPNAVSGQTTLIHLNNCIASVDFACRTLESSNALLTEQSNDFERVAKVLRSKRHFDLVSEQDIRTARDHLSAEIAPRLKELILRAEEALQRDERKAKTLKGKMAQQNTRLEQLAELHGIPVERLQQFMDSIKSDSTDAGNLAREQDDRMASKQQQARTAEDLRKSKQHAKSLQSKRIVMQRDLAKLEQEIKILQKDKR